MKLAVERSRIGTRQAAQGDEPEQGQIAAHVQGHPVVGCPAPHADADGRDLARPDPHARTPLGAACGQPEMVQGADDGLLQIKKEAAHPSRSGGDAEHRIGHQLTRKMAGDVPAAPGLDQFNAFCGQDLDRKSVV